MADFWGGIQSTKGANDFLALSKRLKAAGETDLRKQLHKGIGNGAKPLIPKVRAAALADLPKRGGLNRRIARKPYRVQVRTGAKTAGVRIVGTKVDPRINEGRVWHPVFGRKGKNSAGKKNSVVQQVPQAKGYFSETLAESGPQVRRDVLDALGDFTARITRPL